MGLGLRGVTPNTLRLVRRVVRRLILHVKLTGPRDAEMSGSASPESISEAVSGRD